MSLKAFETVKKKRTKSKAEIERPTTFLTDCHVFKPDTKSDTDLLYLEKLQDTMEKVLLWYWDAPKKILDVTAGERMIWNDNVVNGSKLLTGTKQWDITFADMSPDAKTEIVCDCRALPFADDSYDILVIDLPFIKPQSGLEQFNIEKGKANRDFYFRSADASRWLPPEEIFKDFWKEANRVSKNGLVVKIGERFEEGYEIPVTAWADHYFDKRFNPESDFKRIKKVGYRGRYSGRGARMIHIQRVLTFYMIYKKNYKVR